MDANIIANIIFMIAIIFVAVGLTRADQLSTPHKETIRYIPRSFEEEQNEPVQIEKIFKTMFEEQTPWIGSFNNVNVVNKRILKRTGIPTVRSNIIVQKTKEKNIYNEIHGYSKNIY